MDEKFTQEEQTAIASVLYNLAGVDFQTREGESESLKACLEELGLNANGFVPIHKNMLDVKVYETLKMMSKEKKHTFSRMMTQIARSDGNFGSREQAFVREILDCCDVPFVQK